MQTDKDPGIDIWTEGMEPVVVSKTQTFLFKLPMDGNYHKSPVWAKLELFGDIVDEYAHYYEQTALREVALVDWKWYEHYPKRGAYQLSKPMDAANWEAMREVWFWLSEWDLVQLVQIGPEDSEWYATDKLIELSKKEKT